MPGSVGARSNVPWHVFEEPASATSTPSSRTTPIAPALVPPPEPAPARPSPAWVAPTSTGASGDATAAAAGSRSVTVRRGETLSSIARREGLSLDELVDANPQLTRGGRRPSVIHVGEELYLPGAGADPIAPEPAATAESAPHSRPDGHHPAEGTAPSSSPTVPPSSGDGGFNDCDASCRVPGPGPLAAPEAAAPSPPPSPAAPTETAPVLLAARRPPLGTANKFPDLDAPRGVARRAYGRGEVAIVPMDLRDVVAGRAPREPSGAEAKLLALDFDDPTLKLAAKGNSTNAGVLVQDAEPRIRNGRKDYKTLAKLKSSIARTPCNTSSILAYPQVAKLLKMDAIVPAAILRTIDFARHKPVYEEGLSTRIGHSWQQFPDIYAGTSREAPFVTTKDRTHLFGALSKNPGGEVAYGAFNGPMRGVAYEDRYPGSVRKGAAFAMVSSPKPLAESFGGRVDLPTVAQKTQYARDMADMFVLDALFNQQDRPGNIASVKRLAVADGDRVRLVDPEEATDAQRAAGTPIDVLLLKDNDGGVSLRGAPRWNRTRSERMLESVRHMHPDTYERVLELRDAVNAERGSASTPIRDYFVGELLFSDKDFDGGRGSFVDNLNFVANLLETNKKNGTLLLDADLALQAGLRTTDRS